MVDRNKRGIRGTWIRYIYFEDAFIEKALKSGNYKKATPWVELYLKFRQINIVLYVDKKYSDEHIEKHLDLLRYVHTHIYDFNYKICVGAYILSQICVPPKGTFFVENLRNTICYKKV